MAAAQMSKRKPIDYSREQHQDARNKQLKLERLLGGASIIGRHDRDSRWDAHGTGGVSVQG